MKYFRDKTFIFRQGEADASLRRNIEVLAENNHFRTRNICWGKP